MAHNMSGTQHQAKRRYIALDSWRGIAAICVVILHLPFYSHLFCVELFRNAFLFVDFFFVLSGFVMTHNYYDSIGSPGGLQLFIWKRVARLWPLHFITTMMMIVLFLTRETVGHFLGVSREDSVVTSGIGHFFTSLSLNLLLAQDIWPLNYNDFNGPSWSISVEFFTYILFGLVVLKLKAYRGIIWILLSVFGIAVIAKYSPKFMENQELGIFRSFYGFFLGCLVYQIKGYLTRASTTIEVLAIVIMYITVSKVGFSGMNMISPLTFAFVILVFSKEDGWISDILKTNAFRILGTLSYSIYLNHFFFVLVFRYGRTVVERVLGQDVQIEVVAPTIGAVSATLIGNRWIMDVMTISFVGLVIGFSFLTYRYLEIPWQSRINKFASAPIRG